MLIGGHGGSAGASEARQPPLERTATEERSRKGKERIRFAVKEEG
jgi:hypothetical protein